MKELITHPVDTVKHTVEDLVDTVKTDIEIVKHPGQALDAVKSAVDEQGWEKSFEQFGRVNGQMLGAAIMGKAVKAGGARVSNLVNSTKVVKLAGATDVVGQRMVVNTGSGRAWQLHYPHHGKGIHLQEMRVVPHPKKAGAFRITQRNVKSTTIIPMKDR